MTSVEGCVWVGGRAGGCEHVTGRERCGGKCGGGCVRWRGCHHLRDDERRQREPLLGRHGVLRQPARQRELQLRLHSRRLKGVGAASASASAAVGTVAVRLSGSD